jgi:hypothetical protein
VFGLFGGGRFETLGEATGEGTTVTAANGSKGSYATIGTTGFEYSGFWLVVSPANSSGFRIDVAVSASDVIVFPDLGLDARASGANASPVNIWVPIAVPASTAIKVRAQSTAANTLRALVIGYHGDPFAPAVAGGIFNLNGWSGVDTSVSATPGTTAGTAGAWEELTSSLSRDIVGLYLAGNVAGDTSRTAGRLIVEIGIGAASSEIPILTIQTTNNSNNQNATFGPIWRTIPATTRIAYRVKPSYSSATPDVFGLVGHGIVR